METKDHLALARLITFSNKSFSNLVVAVIVLGDQNHQFVLFDRDGGILLLRPLRRGLSRNIGQDKPEFRSFALFGFHADTSAQMFDDHLADRQSESRALLEGVEFDEAVENLLRFVGGDSAAGVRDPEIKLFAAHFVSEADAARLREFRRVGQQVDDHLREPVAVGADGALFVFLLEEQFDALPDLHADDVLLLPHQFVQVEVRVDEVERPRLDFREVEDVADELQQQGVVVFDDRDVFLLLLLLVGRGQNA